MSSLRDAHRSAVANRVTLRRGRARIIALRACDLVKQDIIDPRLSSDRCDDAMTHSSYDSGPVRHYEIEEHDIWTPHH